MGKRGDRSQYVTLDRALELVRDRTADECWLWPGLRDARGRGVVFHDGKQRKAHRVAYERLVGPIPGGLEPDHTCRNLACFNPKHLEPVTHKVNTLRGEGVPAKNARKTECVNGHALAGDNVYVYRRRWPNGRETEMRVCRQCKLEDTYRRRGKLPPKQRPSGSAAVP
jgi:hypothetical protein